jgi:DNA repair exonuclease SbcCD ATPase subunit
MYDVDDFLGRAHRELAEYDAHERRLEELTGENEARLEELESRLENASREFGALVLPLGDDEAAAALPDLARRFRLPALEAVGKRIVQRRSAIDARLAEIENNRLFRERDVRRGRIEHQLDEEGPLLETARREMERLDALPGFRELVEKGWGTDRYPCRGLLRFFNREFLNDWRRADDVVAALAAEDFDAAATRFRETVEQVESLGMTVGRLHRELQDIDALEKEANDLRAEREQLPQARQALAGRVLAEMVQTRGREAGLADFPSPTDALPVFAAVEGVEHQRRYLDETNGRIRADLAQLAERAGRLRDETRRYEENRYKYRNKRFTDEQFARRFGRTGRFAKLGDRYARTSERVYVFHHYDRGATWNDFLWWDLMTDGRMDGNFISEVAEWRERHPGYTPTTGWGGDRDANSDLSAFDTAFGRDDS